MRIKIRISREQLLTESDNVYFENGEKVAVKETAKYLGCWLNERGDHRKDLKGEEL